MNEGMNVEEPKEQNQKQEDESYTQLWDSDTTICYPFVPCKMRSLIASEHEAEEF